MTFLQSLLVLLHLLGLVGVLGGFLVQLRSPERRILPLQVHGILTQLVTGVLLAGITPGVDDLTDSQTSMFNAKIGVKLVVALLVAALVLLNRRKERIGTGVYLAIGGLELANMAVALFWTIA